MSTPRGRVCIIGAGATGLGVGLGLALNDHPAPVVLLERNPRAGGLAGSFGWRGHTVDFGPHRLSPVIPMVRAIAEELLGPDLLIKKSQHGVHFDGKLYQFPPRVYDWLAPRSFARLARLAGSFAFQQAAWITGRFGPDTFESVLIRKFGRRFFEEVAAPMVSKVWTDPNNLDPAFVSQRFAQIEPIEVIKKWAFPKQELNPATFYYPRLGFQQLWDQLAAYLARHGQSLQFGAEPLGIEARGGRIVRVTARTPAGETVFDDPDLTVVSTIPLAQLTRLLSGIGGEEELRSKARATEVRSMILVAFELAQERTLPYRTLIFPEREFCFNRLFEQNEYSRETVAPGKSVIVADITLRRDDPELRASDDHFIQRARADLARLGYVAADKITDATVKRVEYAYVIPDRHTRSRFHEVLHALKALPNLITLGRFGAGEYDNSDYALDTGITVGGMLAGRMTQGEYLLHMQAKRGRHILG